MSENCACLYGGFDDWDDAGFQCVSMRTARKAHVCIECRQPIQPKSIYEHASQFDGSIWTAKTCVVCAEIRKALYCDGFYFGRMWDDIQKQLFPHFSIACVDKLTSPEAKAELTRRYRKYLGLEF